MPKGYPLKPIPMVGKRFGCLVVIGPGAKTRKSSGRYWACVCDCGETCTVPERRLRKIAGIRSCGCYSHLRTHGKFGTVEYNIWGCMLSRCRDKTNKNYGGNGITVCDRWQVGDGVKTGFECFYEDLGSRPSSKHSIDRLDGKGNYEPGNVCWALPVQQSRNRSITVKVNYRGVLMTLLEAVQKAGKGVSYNTAYQRLKLLGFTVEDAVERPSHFRRWKVKPKNNMLGEIDMLRGAGR